MTRYQRIARIVEENGANLFEAGESLNGSMGDYYILWVNPDIYYLVKEDEGGDIHMLGTLAEVESSGDYLGDTDEIASELDGESYYIVEFPMQDRQLAIIDE